MPSSLLGGGMASGGLGAAAPNTIIPLEMPRSLLRGGLLDSARNKEASLKVIISQGKDFALDCEYASADEHKRLTIGYGQVSAMLWTLMTKWESYR